jgi:hypothetical protein
MIINKVTIDYYEDLGKTSIEVSGNEGFIQRTVPRLLNSETNYPEIKDNTPIQNRNNMQEHKEKKPTDLLLGGASSGFEPKNADLFKIGTTGTGAFTNRYDKEYEEEINRLNELIVGKTNDEIIQDIINDNIKISMPTAEMNTSYELHHYNTGILINNELEKRFKCRYRCPSCHHEANRYIEQGTPFVNCHDCNREMSVRSVGNNPMDYDDFNNFYIAGDKSEI